MNIQTSVPSSRTHLKYSRAKGLSHSPPETRSGPATSTSWCHPFSSRKRGGGGPGRAGRAGGGADGGRGGRGGGASWSRRDVVSTRIGCGSGRSWSVNSGVVGGVVLVILSDASVSEGRETEVGG